MYIGSKGVYLFVFNGFEKYRDKLIMRQQQISNQPEIIRRLGLISINTCLGESILWHVNLSKNGMMRELVEELVY